VDRFFRSLAEDAGDSAVSLVLSGTGSDGSLGIRAIKSLVDVTISQKTDSAK
jgi:two-component system CheB/CheR fusion protein